MGGVLVAAGSAEVGVRARAEVSAWLEDYEDLLARQEAGDAPEDDDEDDDEGGFPDPEDWEVLNDSAVSVLRLVAEAFAAEAAAKVEVFSLVVIADGERVEDSLFRAEGNRDAALRLFARWYGARRGLPEGVGSFDELDVDAVREWLADAGFDVYLGEHLV